MRKHAFWALSIAALLGVAATARAQDSTKKDIPVPGKDTVRKESGGDVATANANFANLLSAVSASASAAEKIGALSALKPEQIHIVDAKDFVTANSEADFAKVSSDNKDGLAALQAAIQKNDAIATALGAHAAKPAATDVVGAMVAGTGDVTIYFRKK
jgi:hypothetical protein